jgi:hypothetical protein
MRLCVSFVLSDELANYRHHSFMRMRVGDRITPDVRAGARALGALSLTGLLVGCGSSKDLDKQLDTVASWAATARLAAAEHRSGAITTTYARQLDDEARHALADARRALSSSERDANETRRAGAALDSLRLAIQLLDTETSR